MAPPDTYPVQVAEAELGLATLGPPWPPPPFSSDEWIARFATLPLLDQPGSAWRYNTGAQVLGVLLERVTSQPLEEFLRDRLFDPLDMLDTSFSVPPASQPRFTTVYAPDPDTGELRVLDRPAGGWWNQPQAMANLAGMLVSTIDDLWAFVAMLGAGGWHRGRRLLSDASVAAMTRNHLTQEQRAANTPLPRRARRMGLRHGRPRPAGGRTTGPLGVRLGRRDRHDVAHRSGAPASPASS